MNKPLRPFGVTIAILSATFVHGMIPLAVFGTMLYLHNWVYQDESGGLSGIQFTNFDIATITPIAIAGTVFILLAMLTWWGRWSVMRLVFPPVTLFYSIFTFASVFQAQSGSVDINSGFDSMMDQQMLMRLVYLGLIVITTIYVWWFMNRWSARAFYRGYYTKQDLNLLQEAGMISQPASPTV